MTQSFAFLASLRERKITGVLYLKAANYYQKAIACDSNNIDALRDLVQSYYKLGSNNLALSVVNKLLLIKPNYVEAITAKGFILERTGDRQEADNLYKRVIRMYSQSVNKTYSDDINKAFLIMMLYGKKKGLGELYKMKTKYPNRNIETYVYMFKNFNRSNFLKNALN